MNWRVVVIAVVAAGVSGCKGSVIVAGNLTSMLIVVAMLWSTLNINR